MDGQIVTFPSEDWQYRSVEGSFTCYMVDSGSHHTQALHYIADQRNRVMGYLFNLFKGRAFPIFAHGDAFIRYIDKHGDLGVNPFKRY
ncbi:hypothetical protein D3C76_1673630 [compost metagenome]